VLIVWAPGGLTLRHQRVLNSFLRQICVQISLCRGQNFGMEHTMPIPTPLMFLSLSWAVGHISSSSCCWSSGI
jgi:hypothetical protein